MLRFAEELRGSWRPLGGGDQPMTVRLEVTAASLWSHLRTGQAQLAGTVHCEALAAKASLAGEILIRPLSPRQRLIRYQFDFAADDGRKISFAGQKDIRWRDPIRTWTSLPGTLTADGAPLGSCELAFALKDGAAFARSFRLW